MALADIVFGAGILVMVLLIVAVMRQVSVLRASLKDGDNADNLIRIETRITEMAFQAERRETAMREELRINREENGKAILGLGETVRKLGADQSAQQQQFRDKLDEKMKELRTENSQKLDEMRKTVDEKLQTTLEKRLSESFKSVSERLEAVQRGLGEMQNLAIGVGDLKRVLTNVKSRGTFGEVQLGLLIEDFLTPDQFIYNYDCGKQTGTQRVEYGIRMPGAEPRFLPVDSKFPTEDYERLLGAVEIGDKLGIDAATKDLVKQIKGFAKDISQKYINPPHTTTEAILFLPTEGLYAEVLRTAGLMESLQRDYSVTVTGPTNFQVLLSTFRMGYQQAVMQEQASEVWKVLGAVKLEFTKFGSDVEKIGKQLNAAVNQTEEIQKRKRMMLRALKSVEAVDDQTSAALLEDTSE
ncbi:DNA recombination protein RmuC [Kordiimonas pumila]|uniref:DNA recombination protein RmuC homolog n=1 Tax=Kordiimonas pumila TaxID=2161677 RepID=A0ABV7D8V9_9PROT|nr:DNA recombination protein RmuC [Kordiimonas pumila]